MINKERNYFKLRKAKKLKNHPYIANLSLFVGMYATGFFKINYNKRFVEFVGSVFPHGIGEDRRVRIQVYELSKTTYIISAVYLDKTHAEVLWVSKIKPKWVSRLKN